MGERERDDQFLTLWFETIKLKEEEKTQKSGKNIVVEFGNKAVVLIVIRGHFLEVFGEERERDFHFSLFGKS